ncbi:MAG TPA: YoaK family protein [Caulifigura sp.]|nr:YoaK family protein [Caulifigura sp.]
MKTLHTSESIYSLRHVPSWLLLAAAAGAVNSFAFMTCQQFVTHLSGTFTQLGMESPRAGLLFDSVAIILSFIAGATGAILLIRPNATGGRRPRWATPLVVVALLLIGVAAAGRLGLFGPFGGVADEPPILLLSLLSLAMGAQNAAVAVTTGLAVRTTHVTGPATDLGINLGGALLTRGRERKEALRAAALRGGKVIAFAVGAGLAVPLTSRLDYWALVVPASFISFATAASFLERPVVAGPWLAWMWRPAAKPEPVAVVSQR